MEKDPIAFIEKAVWDGMAAGGEVVQAAAKPVAALTGRLIDLHVAHALTLSEKPFVKKHLRPLYFTLTHDWRVEQSRKRHTYYVGAY